jgi:DNA repair photolyase
VRQIVEPKAPPIPSRWAAVERLSASGIQVGISATPLMAMVDPRAFARRARLSGANSAWVGGLRLLKNDPFYQVLARHGWLHVLDKAYQAEVREALRAAMPPVVRHGKKMPRGCGAAVGYRPMAAQTFLQPALFEGL